MERQVETLIKRLGNKNIDRNEITQVTLQTLQLADSGLEPYEIEILAVLLTIHQRPGYNIRTCVAFKRTGALVSDMYWDVRYTNGKPMDLGKGMMQSRIIRAGVATRYYQGQEPGEYVILLKDRTPTGAQIPKHWLVPYA